jgi:acyl carrier protein
MNPNLEQAIIQFLANEFHLQPEDVLPDTDFHLDLNLTPDQLTDLIERMQDALDFILAEDKVNEIKTVADLLASLEPDDSHEAV